MNRREFTANLAKLITQMIADGNSPIIDYVLRSTEEQKRLFNAGLSKCDGVEKQSRHQFGRAADIYFFVDGMTDYGYTKTKDLAIKYHKLWEEWGGRTLIEWDLCHYE